MKLIKKLLFSFVILVSFKGFAFNVHLHCTGMDYRVSENHAGWSQGLYPVQPEIVRLSKKEISNSDTILWAGVHKTIYKDIQVQINLFVVEKTAELFEFGVNSIQISRNGIIVDSLGFYDPYIGHAVQAMVRNDENGTGYKCAFMSIEK